MKNQFAVWLTLLVAPLWVPAVAAAAATAPPPLVATTTHGTGERVRGSGRTIEEPRPLAGFTAVHVTGPVEVRLKAADRDAVTVITDDNLAPMIETRLVDGDRPVLEIGVLPGAAFRSSRTPVVVVQFRALSELVMRGSGDVRADRIEADVFVLSMSGSGDARIESIQAKRLAAVLTGSGTLTVRDGRADEQAFKMSGSGRVRAGRLEGRRVIVSSAGSGDALVHAVEALDATLMGSGDIVYRGSPRITQRVSGSGSVRRAR